MLLAGLFVGMTKGQNSIKNEMEGIDQEKSLNQAYVASSGLKSLQGIPEGGLLLIPESSNDRVMAFDPETGDLIDEEFIIDNSGAFFSTPIQVLQSLDKSSLFISDQVADVVHEFDNEGNYLGIFAPAGGANPDICDNVRGICFKEGTDHMLVTSGNTDAVVEFDGSGNYIGEFTEPGRIDPFDIDFWEGNDQYLVADIDGGNDSDTIQVVNNTGGVVEALVTTIDFPEQVHIAPSGNILVATFSSPSGIYEFAPDGAQVGYYDVISSCRGVYELPNGNLLVTSGDGVYEISKTNTLVDTKYSGGSSSFRFISFVAPAGISVTFRVDMSQQTVSPDGVHIAGSFQGWDPGATEMTLEGNDIYTYTHVFNAGDYIEYKFINGDEWGEDESVPGACAQNNNRYLTVPDENIELEAVCYGSCNPCGNPTDVTFIVDMSEQTVSPDGIHIAGSFQGWDPGATEMTNTVNDIYTVTATVNEGETIEFKYINGNDWPGEEQVPAACGVPNGVGGYNRYFEVPVGGAVLDTVCFSSCYPCGFVPTEVDVTFRVDMSQEVVSPNGIHVAGSFQEWDPAASEMMLIEDAIYEATFTLWAGDHHQFKYINGDTWDDAESVPEECGEDDGQGGYNRFIDIPEEDTVLNAVCFGSCDTCVVLPPERFVTFRVDMAEETISPDGIHIAGDFQGWDPGATELTLFEDEIYEVTLPLYEGYHYQYKFINGITWDDAEMVPAECGEDDGQGGYNRYIDVPAEDTTLIALCFGSCSPCGTNPPERMITFRVDMAEQTVSPDGVHLAGSFQDWDPEGTEMTLVEESIYEVSLPLYETYHYQYKFINGITWDDAEIVPEECGEDDGQGGYNRFIDVPGVDSTLLAVCFGECDTCISTGYYTVSNTSNEEYIKIVPNPFGSEFQASYTIDEDSHVKIRITDLYGSVIDEPVDEIKTKGDHTIQIDPTDWTDGIYFLIFESIRGENQVKTTKKLIKK